jgi:anti-sigma factor RsiW
MNPRDRAAERDERLADWVDGRLTPDQLAAFTAELEADAELRERAQEYREGVEFVRRAMLDDSLRQDQPPRNFAAAVMAEVDAAAGPRRWLPVLLSIAAAAAILLAFVWLGQLGQPARGPALEIAKGGEGVREQGPASGLALDTVKAETAKEARSEIADELAPAARRVAAAGEALAAPDQIAETGAPMMKLAPQDGRVGELAADRPAAKTEADAADDKLGYLRSYLDRYRAAPGPADQVPSVATLARPVVIVTLPEAGEKKIAEIGERLGQSAAQARRGAAELGARDAERQDVWMLQPEQSLAPWTANVLPPDVQRYSLPQADQEQNGFYIGSGNVAGGLASAHDRWFVVQGGTEQLEDYVRRLRDVIVAQGGTIRVGQSTDLGLSLADAGVDQLRQRVGNEPAGAGAGVGGTLSLFVVLRGAATEPAPSAAQPQSEPTKRDR